MPGTYTCAVCGKEYEPTNHSRVCDLCNAKEKLAYNQSVYNETEAWIEVVHLKPLRELKQKIDQLKKDIEGMDRKL